MLSQNLLRGAVAQALARRAVEAIGNGLDLLVLQQRKVGVEG